MKKTGNITQYQNIKIKETSLPNNMPFSLIDIFEIRMLQSYPFAVIGL